MKTYFLFDLDGTLTDPKEGICTCVQYALKAFGIDEPDLDKLECFIGPPLGESFQKFYGFSEEDAKKAKEIYRERFVPTGMFENELYPGIHNMLRSLKNAGMHLAVASSKPEPFVEKILKHFKLRDYFEVVVGSNLDGTRESKSEVIMEALRRLFDGRPIEFDKVFMVGDRMHDIEGAHSLRIEAVGVTYGYGSMEELKEAKADYIVRSVEELRLFLMREVRELEDEQKKAGVVTRGDGKYNFKGGDLWRIVYFFLMYVVVRSIGAYALTVILVLLQPKMPASLSDWFFTLNEEGELVTSGNATAIVTAFAFLVAGCSILKNAGKMIRRGEDRRRLTHLTKEPVVSYLLMVAAVIGAVLGLNLLVMQLGLNEAEGYAEVASVQYSCHIIMGLIVYGIISPISEELLFRGLIYNYIRELTAIRPALIITSLLFAFYHGNAVQGSYAFLMGMLLCYGYEYFGTFKAPLLMHMGANLLSYLLTYLLKGVSVPAAPLILVFMAVCVASLLALNKKKQKLI